MRLLLLLVSTAAFAGERAFVETVTTRDTYYVNQPIVVRLRVGIEAEFLKANVVQMFQARLDFPVQVRAPWLKALAGTVVRAGAEPAGSSFALNGAVAQARQVVDREYAVLEIERTYLPTRAGELVISAPDMRFAWGTKFVDNFVNGRTATDQRDEVVTGKAVTLKVLPLPPAPPTFSGAVGRFTVNAETAARTVTTGAMFLLVLRIEGDGNLDQFDTPRLDEFTDFHVYGMIDDRGAVRRTVTYELAALHAGVIIPAIPLLYFDTSEGKYRTIETQPIPLEVTGEARAKQRDSSEALEAQPEPGGGFSPWYLIGAALVLALGVVSYRRSKAGPEAPDPAAAFAARADTDLAAAFTEYLAARLACAPAAVIAPNLAQGLETSGVPAELALRCAAMVEGLVAARYGGAAEDARGAVGALVEELERLR